MDVISLLIVFALGWYIGHKISAAFHVKLFKMILDDLGIDNKRLIAVARERAAEFITPEQEAQLKAAEEDGLEQIDIKVEKHGEMLYAFRKDNDQFLGQGTSRDDLIAAMAQRMKGVRLTVVEGDEYMKAQA